MLFRKRKYIISASLSSEAWRKFTRNPLGMASLALVALITLVAILGYLITPDQSPFANRQCLELGLERPGFSITMLRIKKESSNGKNSLLHRMLFGSADDFILKPLDNYRIEGDSVFFTLYEDRDIPASVQALPMDKVKDIRNVTFLLGTDRFGRDYLSQVLIGARVSLSVGFISVAISLLIGIAIGAVAGYFRGKIDNFIVWFINVIWSIPTLLLVIAITFALGKGFWQVFIAVGLTMWVEVARVVRGQVMGIREKEFVEAARALGFSDFRIISRHVLPNVMAAIIVISAANFASAILLEAGLSFLGLGVQPPVPSWGSMIKENYAYIVLDHAYLAIVPGIAIMLMVLAFMLIGNALRDALDVRTSEF